MDKNKVTIVTEEMLMHDLDEFNEALRHNPSKVKEVQNKGLALMDRYLKNHDDPNYDFDLRYDSKTYDMMDTYIRVFGVDNGELTQFAHKVRRALYSRHPEDLTSKKGLNRNARSYYKKLTKSRSVYYRKLSDNLQHYDISDYKPQKVVDKNTSPASVPETPKHKFNFAAIDYQALKTERKAKRKIFWANVFSVINTRNSRKAALAFTVTALLGVGAFLGLNKGARASQGKDKSEELLPAQIDNNLSSVDSLPKDTISLPEFFAPKKAPTMEVLPSLTLHKDKDNTYANILNNKQSYYQQKTLAPNAVVVKDTTSKASQTTANKPVVVKDNKNNASDTVVDFGAYGPGGKEIVDYYRTHAVTLLGSEEARDAYYEDIFKAISDGKFEMTPNMPIEQIAHFMLVNERVRPNAWQGKLIKKAMNQGLNAQEQQKFNDLMGEPFTICKIKGKGSHSSYNNMPKSQQAQHNKALQKALQGRMYRIANY